MNTGETPSQAPEDGHVPAAGLIAAFGGIRPMAAKLGIAVSTVQGWKQRDAIPRARLAQIEAAAAAHGIELATQAPAPVAPPESPPTYDAPPAENVSATAEEAPPPPPPPAAPKASSPALRMRSPVLLLAVGVLVVIGLGMGAWILGGSLDALAERGDLLARRLAAVEERGAPDAFLGRRLASLEAELAAVKARPEVAPVAAGPELAALTQRLERAEARLAETAGALAALRGEVGRIATAAPRADQGIARALAFAASAGRLRARIASGQGFAEELSAAQLLSPGHAELSAALAALAPYAASGAPDRARLVSEFPARATEALAALRAEDEDWAGRVVARLSQAVSVRRVGAGVAGESAEALIARAEAHLAASSVAGALEELARLPAPASRAFAPFVARAKALLAAEAALALMDAESLALVGAPRP